MIRYKQPDKNKALSLIKSAKSDFIFTLTLPISDSSANTIIRNIYESFRMIGESLLISKGIQSENHVLPIKELIDLNINLPRPIIFLDQLRKIRRNINYYGYKSTKEEAKDILDFSKQSFDLIIEKALSLIE